MPSKAVEEIEIPVVDLILDAYNQADAGKYAEALATIKAAKSVDPRNIYVIALEKLFAKLLSLPPGTATEEARTILPSLLDRALDSARKNHGVGAGEAVQGVAAEEQEEKEARLKEVRDQYFSRADEFVERGDYKSALAEIRRVTIIDPSNRIARQYEEKISQLAGLAPAAAPAEPRKDPPHQTEPKARAARAEEPPHPHAPAERELSAAAKKGKSKTGLLAVIAAVVVIGGVAAFILVKPLQQGSADGPIAQGAPRLTPTTGEVQAEVTQTPQDPGTPIPEPPNVSVATPPSKTERRPAEKESAPPPAKQQAPPQPAAQTPSQQMAPAPAAKQPEAPASQPFVAVEKEPKIVKLERPTLPDVALRSGLTGKVVVKVQIDAQGKPTQATILTSTNHIFDECVIKAVMSSTYQPGMMSTGPVATWMSIPFVFK